MGGAVAYAGLTAAEIGASVRLVTATADSLDLSALGNLELARRSSTSTTAFHNHYDQHGRTQTLLSRADDLRVSDVPAEWRSPKIAHLAPIAREIDLEMCTAFPDSFVGLSAQGLLRDWDAEGRISVAPWDDCLDCLRAADAVVLSIEDLQDWESAERLAPLCNLLVVTQGGQGARYHAGGSWQTVEGIATKQVDPTGAGDIFAALFFFLLASEADPERAAQAANRAAAASVSRAGLASAPSAAEIRAALKPMRV